MRKPFSFSYWISGSTSKCQKISVNFYSCRPPPLRFNWCSKLFFLMKNPGQVQKVWGQVQRVWGQFQRVWGNSKGYEGHTWPSFCCKNSAQLLCDPLKKHRVVKMWANTILEESSPEIISWWAHFEDIQLAHSELTRWPHTVSLLWAFRRFATVTVSSLLPLHGELIGWCHIKLTAGSPCELQIHGKFSGSLQCELILGVHC